MVENDARVIYQAGVPPAEEGFLLRELFLTVWERRRRFLFFSLAVTVLIFGIAGLIYLGQVRRQVTRLKFKLDFDGVQKGEYPNGMKFSTSDIISPLVLSKVYQEDNLQRYMGFPDFKAVLTIIQTSNKLKFLEYEYASRLSDKKMNIQDRERIEAEFLKDKQSLLAPIYILSLSQDTRLSAIPLKEQAKILNDILENWADYAVRVKGADRYQVSLVSSNILRKEDIENKNCFIVTDLLRVTIRRIMNDIEKLKEMPGAGIIKIGEKGISLSDLDYRTKDIEQFKLRPLIGLIRQSGVPSHEDVTLAYLDNRLFELKLDSEEAAARIKVYEDSLDKYTRKAAEMLAREGSGELVAAARESGMAREMPPVIPQLGESFLDTVFQMAQENSDAQFRQEIAHRVIETGLQKATIDLEMKYYTELYDIIKNPISTPDREEVSQSTLQNIIAGHRQIYQQLMQTIDDLNVLYLQLSRVNLNPASLLYTIVEPVTTFTEKSLSTKRFALMAVLAWILGEGLIVFGICVKNVVSGKTG